MTSSACGHHHGSSCIFWVGEQPFQVPGPCRQAGWVHRGLGIPVCLTGQGHSPCTAAAPALIGTEMPTSLLEEVGLDAASLCIPVFCQLGTAPPAGFWPPEFGAEPMLSSPSSAAFRAGRWCWAAPSLRKRGREGMEFAFLCQQCHGLCPPWGRALQHRVGPQAGCG